MTGDAVLQYDIFHIIFIVALISVSLQGTLLPTMAKVGFGRRQHAGFENVYRLRGRT